ncbi:MAG: hypothetical protein JOY93_08415 [Acidobacteriales bacterium]|nr:hypothetical protein [Terriglobales bacterium]
MSLFRATVLLAVVVLAISAAGQHRRDPLSPREVDQLRDAAQEPDIRLKLYLTFARDRLAALDTARADPKITDLGRETHDRLQDFLDVYDELNDNIDTFAGRRNDIRKPLKSVIEADAEFQNKLEALKNSVPSPKDDPKQYEFLLTSTLDTLVSSRQDHHDLLAEQEEAAKHKKLVKPE